MKKKLVYIRSFAILVTTGVVLQVFGFGGDCAAYPSSVGNLSASQEMLNAQNIINVAPVFHRLPIEFSRDPTTNFTGSPGEIIKIPSILDKLDTLRLTPSAIQSYITANNLAPYLSSKSVTYSTSVAYSPDQIRAAYGLPTIANANPTSLGAGQTIYIIDAYDDPNAINDLNYFSSQKGLPTCTGAIISASQSVLPLSNNSCTVSIIYLDQNGNRTDTAPNYDEGWASEISLDLQWAHAIAPLANLVLIEANNSYSNMLAQAIDVANVFGNGVVSMSFGGPESSYVTSSAYGSGLFSNPTLTYFASTGDAGPQVNWPAVEPQVTAVGGTSLDWNGISRIETAWASTGGGVSQFVSRPSFQMSITSPNDPSNSYRLLPDVSALADPNTGVPVYITPPGGTGAWGIFGGTSLSSPISAALTAIGNAERSQMGFRLIGDEHQLFYSALSTKAYNTYFYDVTSGSSNNGSTSLNAILGYDLTTGLGTPGGILNGLQAQLNLISAPAAYLPLALQGGGLDYLSVNGSGKVSQSNFNASPDWVLMFRIKENGNKQPGLVWYNSSKGSTAVWLMSGDRIFDGNTILTDPNWKVIGTPDFDGDGNDNLLWYNASTGSTNAWILNGTQLVKSETLLTDPNWRVVATPDLNGDGKDDILWDNASAGSTAAWIMNGTQLVQGSTLLTDPNWKVVATPDLNGDGKDDILWFNASTGSTNAWIMDGTQLVQSEILLTDPNWKVVGTPDLNGDGKDDILWYNASTGSTAAWIMNGTQLVQGSTLLTDPNWKVVGTQDINGDRNDDLIWYNAASGETALWIMNGLNLEQGGLLNEPAFAKPLVGSLLHIAYY